MLRPAVLIKIEFKTSKSGNILPWVRLDVQNKEILLEVFTGNVALATKVVVDINDNCSENTEKNAKAKNHKVTHAFREWWFSPKEGFLASVSLEWRDFQRP